MTTEASEGAIHSAAARESATTLTTRSLSWRWWISLSAAVVLAALALGGGLSVYIANTAAPSMQRAGQIDNLKDRVTAEKDLLQYQADNQTKVWTAIVQALGAVVLGVGAVATWRNLRVAQENVWVAQNNLEVSQRTLRLTEKRLDIDREAQITNRFTQAIQQLGSVDDGQPNLEIRLGGIYALDRLTRDSAPDHWTIMNVLTTYVRQNAPWPLRAAGLNGSVTPPGRPRTDIQAILDVLGRRSVPEQFPEPGPLDLSRTYLHGANLIKARLHQAVFSRARLQKACFDKAQLEGADFTDADLHEASFDGADLSRADFRGAVSTKAVFDNARLEGARFEVPSTEMMAAMQGEPFHQPTQLQGASFVRAQLPEAKLGMVVLTSARFDLAVLRGANFWDAQLADAVFQKADLQGAYFGGTRTDLSEAILDDANLQKAQFHGSKLPKAWLKGADLTEAEIDEAQMEGADLTGAKAPRASFRGANVMNAMFSDVDLTEARFYSTNLEGASLWAAVLERADFTGAKLKGASFQRAQLKGTIFSTRLSDGIVRDAEGLVIDQLTDAESVEDVVLPSYLRQDDLTQALRKGSTTSAT